MPANKPTRGSLLNKTHKLARGLVGLWLLNEGSGNKVFDLSGHKNTGTFIGDTAWSAGNYGTAIKQTTNGDAIQVADSPSLNPTEAITIYAIVRPVDVSYVGISTKHDLVSTGYGKHTLYIEDAKIIFKIAGGTATGSITIVANTLYHICGTYDRQSIKVYVNAVEDVSQAETAAIGSESVPFYIGTYYRGGAQSFEGLVEVVYVYNRALFSPEIVLLYRKSFCMFRRRTPPQLFVTEVIEPEVVHRMSRHIGFRPVEGADRLRGLRRNAMY